MNTPPPSYNSNLPRICAYLFLLFFFLYSATFIPSYAIVCGNDLNFSGREFHCVKRSDSAKLRCADPTAMLLSNAFIARPNSSCASDEECCMLPEPGSYGGACRTGATKWFNSTQKSVFAPLQMQTDQSGVGCILFGTVCPIKIFTSIVTTAQDSFLQSVLGKDDPSLACRYGIPDTITEDGRIDPNKPCTCVDQHKQLTSGVLLLCAKYVAKMPTTDPTGGFRNTPWLDSILTRQLATHSVGKVIGSAMSIPGHLASATIPRGIGNMVNDASLVIVPPTEWGDFVKRLDLIYPGITRNKAEFERCVNLALSNKYYSALGPISLANPQDFIYNIIGIGMGIASATFTGGCIYASIRIQLSQGNAEEITKAKDLFLHFLMGLGMIFFSIFILKFIGVSVLQIYGLS